MVHWKFGILLGREGILSENVYDTSRMEDSCMVIDLGSGLLCVLSLLGILVKVIYVRQSGLSVSFSW